MTKNEKAFLDMIAACELGYDMMARSDNGYNILVGSRVNMIFTFSSYHRHPGVLIDIDGKPGGLESTAAGRYQLLSRCWKPYCDLLGISDFSPASQDKIALQQIKECGAMPLINAGDVPAAIARVNRIWASLPGSPYGQHTHPLNFCLKAYTDAGGDLRA